MAIYTTLNLDALSKINLYQTIKCSTIVDYFHIYLSTKPFAILGE